MAYYSYRQTFAIDLSKLCWNCSINNFFVLFYISKYFKLLAILFPICSGLDIPTTLYVKSYNASYINFKWRLFDNDEEIEAERIGWNRETIGRRKVKKMVWSSRLIASFSLLGHRLNYLLTSNYLLIFICETDKNSINWHRLVSNRYPHWMFSSVNQYTCCGYAIYLKDFKVSWTWFINFLTCFRFT